MCNGFLGALTQVGGIVVCGGADIGVTEMEEEQEEGDDEEVEGWELDDTLTPPHG